MRELLPLVLLPLAATAGTPNNSGNHDGDVGQLPPTLAPPSGANEELVEACGAVEVSALGNEMNRMPYLQRTTTTSTRVMWAGDNMEGSVVVFTTPDGEPYGEAPAAFEGRGTEEATDRWIAEMG